MRSRRVDVGVIGAGMSKKVCEFFFFFFWSRKKSQVQTQIRQFKTILINFRNSCKNTAKTMTGYILR